MGQADTSEEVQAVEDGARYFGRFNRSRNDRWVFGDKDAGARLPKFAWTKIVRHAMVAGAASPDDPGLARYWADRRGRKHNGPLSVLLLARLKTQRGRCPLCGTLLLHADREPQNPREWEQWLRGIRTAIRELNIAAGTGPDDQRLIHTALRTRTARQQHQHCSLRPWRRQDLLSQIIRMLEKSRF